MVASAAPVMIFSHWMDCSTAKLERPTGSVYSSLLVSSILQRVRPIDLRYYLGAAHYRSNIEFHESSLAEAASAMGRIEGFMTRAAQWLSAGSGGLASCR